MKQLKVTGVSFSSMGAGKTSEVYRTWPLALFLGVPSAVRTVALSVSGLDPEAIWPWVPVYEGHDPRREWLRTINAAKIAGLPEEIRHTDDQIEVLQWLAEPDQGWIAEQFGTVVYDDQALIDAMWVAEQRKRFAAGDRDVPRTGSGAFDVRAAYGILNEKKVDMSSLTRHLDANYWVTTHLIEAGRDERGNSWGTGPNLGSKAQMDRVPAWIECCYWLQGSTPAQCLDPWHQATYFVDKTKTRDIKTKDRTNICWPSTPANLRAIFTASALEVRMDRVPGLEWQDEVMHQVAERGVDTGLDRAALMETMIEAFMARAGIGFVPLSPETDEQKHVAWAISDGLALAVIRHRQRTATIDSWLGSGPSATPAGARQRPTAGSRPKT